jgi:hypothetical protein
MKLAKSAILTPKSRVSTIFLPSSSHTRINPSHNEAATPAATLTMSTTSKPSTLQNIDDSNDRDENFLRKNKNVENNEKFTLDKIKQINLNEVSKRNKGKLRFEDDSSIIIRNTTSKPPTILTKKHRRRNDKFLHRRPTNPEDYELFMSVRERPAGIDYYDCMTAGWGKFSTSGDLSDVLLKIDVPIHNIKR